MNKNMAKSMNRIPSWLKGSAVSLIISASFIFLLPFFIFNGMIQKDYIKYLFYVIQCAAVFLGAYLGNRSNKSNILIGSILLEIVYLVAVISFSVIFFDGISHGIWGSVICCTIGMFAAVLVKMRQHNGVGRKRRRAN